MNAFLLFWGTVALLLVFALLFALLLRTKQTPPQIQEHYLASDEIVEDWPMFMPASVRSHKIYEQPQVIQMYRSEH
jgi:hypothetical protein